VGCRSPRVYELLPRRYARREPRRILLAPLLLAWNETRIVLLMTFVNFVILRYEVTMR